jgi:phenylacetate-CoA ligase
MYWDEKIETLKPADLAALQLKRLKRTLKQVQNVGFYQKRLAEAGVKTSSIKTLDDIRKMTGIRSVSLPYR